MHVYQLGRKEIIAHRCIVFGAKVMTSQTFRIFVLHVSHSLFFSYSISYVGFYVFFLVKVSHPIERVHLVFFCFACFIFLFAEQCFVILLTTTITLVFLTHALFSNLHHDARVIFLVLNLAYRYKYCFFIIQILISYMGFALVLSPSVCLSSTS